MATRSRRSFLPLAALLTTLVPPPGTDGPDSKKLPLGESSPRAVAERVAERIGADTQFGLNPAVQQAYAAGAYVVEIGDAYALVPEGDDLPEALYYVRSRIMVDSSAGAAADVQLGISFDAGFLELRIGESANERIESTGPAQLVLADYDITQFSHRRTLNLAAGEYDLRIKWLPEHPLARLYLGFLRQDGQPPAGISLLPPVSAMQESHQEPFWIAGPFDASRGFDMVHEPDTTPAYPGAAFAGIGGRTVGWDFPRRHLVSRLRGPLDLSDWRYFTGTFLSALYDVTDHFRAAGGSESERLPGLDYTEFVNRHLNFFLDHRSAIAAERDRYGLLTGPFGHYFRYTLLDDFGMQTVPYAMRMLRGASNSRLSEDRALVERAVGQILEGVKRLEDGTFARLNPDSLTVWADDLFMGGVLLVRAADVLNRPELLDEAARQVILFDQYLRDPESGLYWHGWLDRRQEHSSSKWARANGWTMMAKVEVLSALPTGHPHRQQVLAIFRRHAEALRRMQSSEGRWHQVLDRPGTYLETSATAMFVRAFAEGVVRGWLDRATYHDRALLGWEALAAQVQADGSVEGIVRGTPIMFSDEAYDRHPVRLNDPRGLGAVLWAAVSMDRLIGTAQ